MWTKFFWTTIFCALLASCTPGTVGIGVGGGHHGAGGGVGVSFPVDNQSDENNYSARDDDGGYTYGATGTSYGAGYPPHNCVEPQGLPPDRDDPYILRQKYWDEVDDYRDCIQAYIARAKQDQQFIQNRIEQANREYQRFMTFGN